MNISDQVLTEDVCLTMWGCISMPVGSRSSRKANTNANHGTFRLLPGAFASTTVPQMSRCAHPLDLSLIKEGDKRQLNYPRAAVPDLGSRVLR